MGTGMSMAACVQVVPQVVMAAPALVAKELAVGCFESTS